MQLKFLFIIVKNMKMEKEKHANNANRVKGGHQERRLIAPSNPVDVNPNYSRISMVRSKGKS